ncbi:uncharacterized protein VTP21DRAFT_506 [Calcarisporiella thermophila]|uniref:uncharacterized protein n=1 Tax=Calcarisporiella thermophila TaxID=911321 RepID=UPI003743D051
MIRTNAASRSIQPIASEPTLDGGTATHDGPEPLSLDFLRKQARQLEHEIEIKLVAFSKMGASTSSRANHGSFLTDGPSGNEAAELEIDELLKKLTIVVNSMNEFTERPSANRISSSLVHVIQRHRDMLYDYSKEFRKTRANLRSMREHNELLSQIRDDMNKPSSSNTEHLLTERNRIDNSHRMTDMLLEQAYSTRENLDKQRSLLQGANRRLVGLVGQIPGINTLINRIHTRRRRDTFIMAGVISTCICLILLYWFNT